MKIKKIFYLLVILHLFSNNLYGLENKITLKVNDKIITSFDIKQEAKYLIVLNKNLKKIDQVQLNNLAKNSIVKEKIKEIELTKYYQIENALNDTNLDKITKNLYKTVGFQSEKEFINYLNTLGLKFTLIKRKLAIEMLWNNLIFEKFNKRVVIDKEDIKINLNKEIEDLSFTRNIFLSEILIKNYKNIKLDLVYQEILESIDNVGFEATANIYSMSNTAKFGGKIGWIKENSLSNQIAKNLSNLKKGQISKPIKINENFLILKVNDIKINKEKINKEQILKNRISYKRNQQLERFSLAYFSKVKQNIQIDEL